MFEVKYYNYYYYYYYYLYNVHLFDCRYSIEFKIEAIRKESSLNSQYDTSLIALMKLFNNKYCNSEIVANYYGCPSLKLMIDDVLIRAKEDSAIGAAYEIFLVSKIKTMGTIFEISHIWGQPTKILRQICNDLKKHTKHLKAEDFKILLDEMKHSRAIRSELSRSIKNTEKSLSLDRKRNSSPLKKNEISKRSNEFEAKIKNNNNNSINYHPLILFNCSAGGPAFGPIIF